MRSMQYQLAADSSGEGCEWKCEDHGTIGETEVNEMNETNRGTSSNKNILWFDIAVDDVSRVDIFQIEKLVKFRR